LEIQKSLIGALKRNFKPLRNAPFPSPQIKESGVNLIIGTDDSFLIAAFESHTGRRVNPFPTRARLGWSCFCKTSRASPSKSKQIIYSGYMEHLENKFVSIVDKLVPEVIFVNNVVIKRKIEVDIKIKIHKRKKTSEKTLKI
jgi:hypothetical protein